MKKPIKIAAAIALLGTVLWGCKSTTTPSATNVSKVILPTDVCKSCVVSQDTFKTWFKNGVPAANAAVVPANSVTFTPNNNCDFYRWSEQMFLWITSPDSSYGSGGKIVLESPVFYNVSPPDSAGNRILTPHKPDSLFHMAGHIRKLGPNRLPAFMDKKGRLFEIEEAKPIVKDATGKPVEVGEVKPATANGIAQLLDKAGKPIVHPMALIHHKVNAKFIVQRVKVGKSFVFLDGSGNQVQAEQAQATDDIMMSQGKSLVYYLSLVNDVYAYYMTGVRNHDPSIDSTSFPTTAAARDAVCKYARKNHAILPDSNALAIEIKSSWVEASTLPNPQDYVTVNAIIPTYDTTNNQIWKPNGEKKAKMALVGIHIVGSVAHHPEMIWATFEHESNTPNAKYQYVDSTKAKTVKTVPQDKGTGWLFSNTTDTALTAYNNSHMTDTTATGAATDNIIATPGNTISPSNTMQTLPWGSAWGQPTNQQDSSSAASNSEIISINNNVRGMIPGEDIRKNYLFIGAIWTFKGTPPTGNGYDQNPVNPPASGTTIGTSVLANTTMETYFQSPNFSCFTCHSDSPASFAPASISHIFSKLEPLYRVHDQLNKKKK